MGLFVIGLILCGIASAANGLYTDPHCEPGTAGIVYLFEWRWADIEKECPRLAKRGFCGVQTSVPTEHIVRNDATWMERFLVVSYDLVTRSGDEDDFTSMVRGCTAAGVRIFVTLQLDHMSPDGGNGYNETPHNAAALDYPGVPYNASHFHTTSDCSNPRLSSSSPAKDMQDCWALTYPDLDQANPHVRDMILKLLNRLVAKGVAGFFLSDSMHIDPEDIRAILDQVDDVKFGGRPFMIYEMVNTMPSKVDPRSFYPVGRVTDFSMSQVLGQAVLDEDLSGLCLLLDPSKALVSRAYASVLPSEYSLVFVHNVDYQRNKGPRGVKVVTYKTPELYKLALSFVLASGYGVPKIVSSYDFTDDNQGPPSDAEGDILEVPQTDEEDCGTDWICEHRYPSVKDMVNFNSMFSGEELKDCKAETTKVSFSKGEEGHYWATFGTIADLWEDLPKQRKWDAAKNDYIEELRSDNLTVFDFGGIATVALYAGSLAPITLSEKPTTALTTEQEAPVPTTTEEAMAEITTTEAIAETTAEEAIAETTTEEAIAETTTEEAIAKTTTEDAIAETTTEEAIAEPTTEEAIAETTTEEAIAETTTEEAIAEPTTTEKLELTTTAPTTTTATVKPTTTKTTTTKKPKPTSDFRETIIFLKRQTQPGQEVFIIGRNLNKTVADTKIPIRHMDLQVNKKIDQRNSWIIGDNFLDWNGREKSQYGLYNGDYAKGTPAQWTTNNWGQNYYSALNKYGDSYWLVRVEMDCLKTNNGFFEVRGVMNSGTHEYISRGKSTGGTQCKAGNITPPDTQYHVGMCGKINIFTWGTRNCRIEDLD